MTRILADLPEDDIKWLDACAAEQGKSRAAVLREAVVAYRAEAAADWITRGFGVWKGRVALGDAVDWQQQERTSWSRRNSENSIRDGSRGGNSGADG